MNPKEYAAKRLSSLIPEGATGPTGPRTPEGKRRSSLNATKHSLCGKIHIATPEESAAFDAHCKSYRDALAPIGTLEQELAHEIAEDRWRLKRARAIENSIFARGHLDHIDDLESGHPEIDAALAEGKTWILQAKNIELLTLYENRIRRAVERNTTELKAMQAERKAAYAEARSQAVQLARVAESEGVTYNSTPDFTPASDYGEFEFSAPEIARYLDRGRRLHLALNLPVPDPRQPSGSPRAA